MKVLAIVKRIIKQFFRDKRSLALLIFAPILVLTLLWLVLDANDYQPVISSNDLPDKVEETLENATEKDMIHLSESEATSAIQDGKIDAYVSLKEKEPFILLEGTDTTVNKTVIQLVQQALKSSSQGKSLSIDVDYLYGSEDLQLFDQIGPVLIGFFIFFFVFIIGGISFLRERTSGTLEKLLSTPIKRWEVVVGYLIGFGIFTIIQSLIIVSFSIYVLDMWMVGEFWQLLIVTFLLAITALTLATLLSSFANNEFQIMQFIPLVIIPQLFFSGVFPLSSLPEWVQILSKWMPLTYGANAMQAIMIKGQSVLDIWGDLAMILLFALIFFVTNIFALKKHRAL